MKFNAFDQYSHRTSDARTQEWGLPVASQAPGSAGVPQLCLFAPGEMQKIKDQQIDLRQQQLQAALSVVDLDATGPRARGGSASRLGSGSRRAQQQSHARPSHRASSARSVRNTTSNTPANTPVDTMADPPATAVSILPARVPTTIPTTIPMTPPGMRKTSPTSRRASSPLGRASTLSPTRSSDLDTQGSQGSRAKQEEQGQEDERYSLRPGLGYYSGSPQPAAGLPTHAEEEEEGQLASSQNLPRHTTSPSPGMSSSDGTPRQTSGSRSKSPSKRAPGLPHQDARPEVVAAVVGAVQHTRGKNSTSSFRPRTAPSTGHHNADVDDEDQSPSTQTAGSQQSQPVLRPQSSRLPLAGGALSSRSSRTGSVGWQNDSSPTPRSCIPPVLMSKTVTAAEAVEAAAFMNRLRAVEAPSPNGIDAHAQRPVSALSRTASQPLQHPTPIHKLLESPQPRLWSSRSKRSARSHMECPAPPSAAVADGPGVGGAGYGGDAYRERARGKAVVAEPTLPAEYYLEETTPLAPVETASHLYSKYSKSTRQWRTTAFPAAVPYQRKDVVRLHQFFEKRVRELESEGHVVWTPPKVSTGKEEHSKSAGQDQGGLIWGEQGIEEGGKVEPDATEEELEGTCASELEADEEVRARMQSELLSQEWDAYWKPSKAKYPMAVEAIRAEAREAKQAVRAGRRATLQREAESWGHDSITKLQVQHKNWNEMCTEKGGAASGEDGGDAREEVHLRSDEDEEEGDDQQEVPHPSAHRDWAKLAEQDPVCVGGRVHMEAVAQTMGELIRQTTTECVQRAQLMTRVWAHTEAVVEGLVQFAVHTLSELMRTRDQHCRFKEEGRWILLRGKQMERDAARVARLSEEVDELRAAVAAEKTARAAAESDARIHANMAEHLRGQQQLAETKNRELTQQQRAALDARDSQQRAVVQDLEKVAWEKKHLQDKIDILNSELDTANSKCTKMLRQVQELQHAQVELSHMKQSHTPRPDWPSLRAANVAAELASSDLSSCEKAAALDKLFFKAFQTPPAATVAATEPVVEIPPPLIRRRSSKIVFDTEDNFFVCLGTGSAVPMYLRLNGKVRNRNFSLVQTRKAMLDIWRDKMSSQDSIRLKMPQFLYLYLQRKYGSVPSVVAEWGYNLTYYFHHYASTDPQIEIFQGVMEGAYTDDVFQDTLQMLDKLQAYVREVDYMTGGTTTGTVKKSEFLQATALFFPFKSEKRLKDIKALLTEAEVPYAKWFEEEDRESGLHPLVKLLLSQYIAEHKEYAMDVRTTLEQKCEHIDQHEMTELAKGVLTAQAIAECVRQVDPNLGGREVHQLIMRGFESSSVGEDHTIPVDQFMANLQKGVLKKAARQRRRSSKLASTSSPRLRPGSATGRENSLRSLSRQSSSTSLHRAEGGDMPTRRASVGGGSRPASGSNLRSLSQSTLPATNVLGSDSSFSENIGEEAPNAQGSTNSSTQQPSQIPGYAKIPTSFSQFDVEHVGFEKPLARKSHAVPKEWRMEREGMPPDLPEATSAFYPKKAPPKPLSSGTIGGHPPKPRPQTAVASGAPAKGDESRLRRSASFSASERRRGGLSNVIIAPIATSSPIGLSKEEFKKRRTVLNGDFSTSGTSPKVKPEPSQSTWSTPGSKSSISSPNRLSLMTPSP